MSSIMKDKGTVAQVTIDRVALAEMATDAVKFGLPFPTQHLSYSEVQQVLTLHTLAKLLQSYGVEAPFALKVGPKDG